jgi:hypothetical protein
MIFFDPFLDLFFEGIKLGTAIGSRMGYGDQFRVAQIFTHRVSGYAQSDRDVLNRLALCS